MLDRKHLSRRVREIHIHGCLEEIRDLLIYSEGAVEVSMPHLVAGAKKIEAMGWPNLKFLDCSHNMISKVDSSLVGAFSRDPISFSHQHNHLLLM